MPLHNSWVRNGPIRLHYLHNGGDVRACIPLLIVPGTAEAAEDYADLLAAIRPRFGAALSLRGRGQSSSPQAGYSLDHHVSDLACWVEALNLGRFCLMGFSRGVAYALAYAAWQVAEQRERIAGLIIGDYPAFHPALRPEWVTWFLDSTARGIPVRERLMPHAVAGIQREAENISLWEALPALDAPALILRGGQPGSLLKPQEAELYLDRLPHAEIVVFEDSGHRLWEPDFGRYLVTIGDFLERLDRPDPPAW